MTSRLNTLDQKIDISGSLDQEQNLELALEPQKLGKPLGISGINASVTGGTNIISGLSGITTTEGNYINLFNTTDPNNSGSFLITEIININSIAVANVFSSNESNVPWEIYQGYSLEDDLNYTRTDRSAIKGVNYYDNVPEYYQIIDTINSIPANLSNIAGKTTDAKAFVVNEKFENATVSFGDNFITLLSPGNLKHADAINLSGIPVFDGYDLGNWNSTYASIFDGYTGHSLNVLSGINAGNRIFGQTRSGSSVSPNSVELFFYSIIDGYDITTAIPYTWEAGQPNNVDIYYGYRNAIIDIDENAFRLTQINGAAGGAGGGSDLPTPTVIGEVLYCIFPGQYNRAQPITTDAGWMVNMSGILIVNDLEN